MIPFCRDEISTRPAGVDFSLRLNGEISLNPGKVGQVSTRYLQKPIDPAINLKMFTK